MRILYLFKKRVMILLLVSLFFLCLSCTEKKLQIDRSEVPVQQLQSVLLKTDSLLYGSLNAILSDKYVLFTSYKRERLFEIFELQKDSLLYRKSFLEKGEGPCEMFTPFFCYDSDSKDLVVSDANVKNGLIINLADINVVDSTNKWKRINAFSSNMAYYWYGYVSSSDSTVLAKTSCQNKKSIFTELNLNNGGVKDIENFWPEDEFEGNEKIKQAEYGRGNHSCLLKHPTENRYFYSSKHGYYAELFSLEDGKAVDKQLLFDIYPEYNTKDGMNPSESGENGMGMTVFATNAYVYIKFNRGTIADYREQIRNSNHKLTDDYSFSNEILVYDWNGQLKKIYKLDSLVRSFFVDENDKFILANTDDDETGDILILQYNI